MALKRVSSPMKERENLFKLLPSEQRTTEETLIKLERRIAKCVRKNENVLSQSEMAAAKTTLR